MKLFILQNANYEEGYSLYMKQTILAESVEQAKEIANQEEETNWILWEEIDMTKPQIISQDDVEYLRYGYEDWDDYYLD